MPLSACLGWQYTVKLLIKIKNRNPRTLPCGTPLVTGKKDDNALLIQTHWHLSVMKAHIQLKVLFAIAYNFKTENNIVCDTVSNP